jgi:hypothetical protein
MLKGSSFDRDVRISNVAVIGFLNYIMTKTTAHLYYYANEEVSEIRVCFYIKLNKWSMKFNHS